MSILDDIYDGAYRPTQPLEAMPEQLRKKRLALSDALEKIGAEEVFEEHWDTLCKIEEFTDHTNFREGFRLGVALMLELL